MTTDSQAAPTAPKFALTERRIEQLLLLGVAAGIVFSLVVLLIRLNAGLLDQHDFRQSQTALTVQWMTRGGPLLGYETPVLGYPWKIPFEFPLYQWIVAALSTLGVPMNAAGRLVNWAFYAGALALAASTMRRLGAPRPFALMFVVLMLFSPLYVFWSRTFMIESTAVFLSVLFLYGLVEYRARPHWIAFAIMTSGAVLAALVKITTFLPFALGGGLLVIVPAIQNWLATHDTKAASRALLGPAAAMVLSLFFLMIWLHYADALKEQNPAGALETGKHLTRWNFGTLAQRLDLTNWRHVFLGRDVRDALGTPWVVLIAAPLLLVSRKMWPWAVTSMALYLATFMVFTNLHVEHNYYAYANAGFCVLFAASALYGLFEPTHPAFSSPQCRAQMQIVALALLGVVVLLQINSFRTEYWQSMKADQSSNRANDISQHVAATTSVDEVAFAFGYDWSPIIAYMSGRRVITLPEYASDAVLSHMDDLRVWTGGRSIGAVVDCRGGETKLSPFVARVTQGLQRSNVAGCLFYDRPAH